MSSAPVPAESQQSALLSDKDFLSVSTLDNESSRSQPAFLQPVKKQQRGNPPFPVRELDITSYKRRRPGKATSLQASDSDAVKTAEHISQSFMSLHPREVEEHFETCFVPKEVRLKGLEDIYATHFVVPRPVLTPPEAVKKSFCSGRKLREVKGKESTVREVRAPSELPSLFPVLMQRPMLTTKLQPLGRNHSQRPRVQREQSAENSRFSPYSIRFMQPYIRRNFKLTVGLDAKSAKSPPRLVIRKTKDIENEVKRALKVVSGAV